MNSAPLSQSRYQIRFDWGIAGARSIGADADVLVWVDALAEASASPLSGLLPGSPASQAMPRTTAIAGSLPHRRAVARWVLERQARKGDRLVVAVIAAGATRPDGSARFAVEDLLAAGAVIDALAEVGIDFCSPEAAAASAAFSGLRHATGHLIGASVSGRELADAGRKAEIRPAVAVDSSDEVHVLWEFSSAP